MKLQNEKRWLQFYPEDVNPHLEIKEMTLNDLLQRAVERFGSLPSIEFRQSQWSYIEVQKYSEYLATNLYKMGLRKGDRLSVMLPNCPEYILSAFAVFRIGGIVVQTSPLYVERELEYQLNDTEAEFMICHASVYERVKKIQSNTSLKTIIVVSEERSPNLADDDFYFEDCLKRSDTKLPEISIEPMEDVAVLQYTGGTTGHPKGGNAHSSKSH